MTFDEMEKGDLREYLDFLMRQYRVVDAFWYIYLEEAYGTETANHFNEKVWGRVAGLAAREIVKKFDISEKGLEGFVKALRYFPWTMIVGYHIEQTPQGSDSFSTGMPDSDGTFEPRTSASTLAKRCTVVNS